MKSDEILLKEFITNHSSDASRLLEQLKFEQLVPFFNKLQTELSIELIQEMDMYPALKCIEEMETKSSGKIIEGLPTNLASSFLRKMKKEKREQLLQQIDPHVSRSLEQMLFHFENTAGALMNPQVPTISENLNVKEAFDRVRKNKQQSFQYIYVLNQDLKLLGIVKLEDLLVADPKEQIDSIMDKEFTFLFSEVEIKKVADHQGWLDYNSLPVLDRSGIFLGALNQGVLRKTDIDKSSKISRHAVIASNALGELYRIGLSGLLYGSSVQTKETE